MNTSVVTSLTTQRPGRRKRAETNGFLVRDLVTLLSIGLGLVIVLHREYLLPARFLGDEKTIQTLAQQSWETTGDSSYNTVATLYRLLGLADAPVLAALVGFATGCLPYLMILRSGIVSSTRGFALAIIPFGILLTSIYLGTYSKEVFIVPIVIMVLVMRSGLGRSLLLFTAVLAYAYFFRNYWFFLAAAFLVLLVAKKFLSPRKVISAVAPTLVIVGSALIVVLMGVPGDYYRSSVNTYRESYGDVNSLIPRYLGVGEPLSGIANNFLSYVFLQFPFPLLARFSPYYVLLALIIGGLWIVFYKALLQGSWRFQSRDDDSKRYTRVSLILISFLVTQSFFEPDYGSALKHLTPFVPALLWVYIHSYTQRSSITKERNRLEA